MSRKPNRERSNDKRPKLPDGHGLYWHDTKDAIYTRFWVRGQEFRLSCKTTNPQGAAVEARRLRAEKEQDPSVGRRRGGPGSIELLAADDILEHKKRGVTDLHINRLKSKWVVVLRNLNDVTKELKRPPEAGDITYDVLRSYEGLRRQGVKTIKMVKGQPQEKWRDRPARGQTIVREFRCIKRALENARRQKLIRGLPDPWPEVRRNPKCKQRSGKLWPPDLIAEFLSHLHDDARDEIEFDMLTGVRSFELKRVAASWVEPAPPGAETPYILRLPEDATKSRIERVVGLPQRAFDIVKRRLEADPEREAIFSQGDHKKHRQAVARRLGWPASPTLRDIRHTYASLALRGTSDPVAVMRSLGHKDLRTTEMYLSSTLERITSASAAVEKAFLAKASKQVAAPAHDGTQSDMLKQIVEAVSKVLEQSSPPEPPHRSPMEEPMLESIVSTGNHLERATRLELATLSLGSRHNSAKFLQSLANEIGEAHQKTALNGGQPEPLTGAPKRAKGDAR